MTYADDMDDADAGRADMAALLHEDPADWPAAHCCPDHGWYALNARAVFGCPACFNRSIDRLLPWPAATRHCPTHGWWTPRTHDYGCPTCIAHDLDQAMRYDAHHDHEHAHPEGP